MSFAGSRKSAAWVVCGFGGESMCTPMRSRRSRSRRRRPSEAAGATWSREERIYQDAQRRAAAKARFMRSLVQYLFVVGVLAFVLPGVAWIVGICWGLGLLGSFVKRNVEPSLRQRWIDQEVHRQLNRTASARRREIEGEHTRRIGEISASIAHEIRNPITAAKSLVQQMGEDPGSPENVEYAQVALEELDRVEKSISHLLRFAREEDLRMVDMQMARVIESALDGLRDRLAHSRVELVTAIDAEGSMRGDSEQLRRVILNLVGNALDAVAEPGITAPRVEVHAGENLAGTEVWVRVRDNGPGIEPERLQKIFSPFYTSKDSGTGLGLAISKKVVEAHGGSIEVDSSRRGGSEFLLTFPKHPTSMKA